MLSVNRAPLSTCLLLLYKHLQFFPLSRIGPTLNDDFNFVIFRKSRDFESIEFTPSFFRGCVLNHIERFFGEIGGQTSLEIIRFSVSQRRCVFRVPKQFSERTRATIALIGRYQDVPCHIRVLNTSDKPLDFIKEGEGEDCEEG